MKYTVIHVPDGEDEVIVRYSELTPEVEQVLSVLRGQQPRLLGSREGEQVMIAPGDILYIECVDSKSFACTAEDVFRLEHTMTQLEQILCDINFFRCSRSMIINIDKVESLRSLSSNRIDATMLGGEHIIISRRYASEFRKLLRGGRDYE
ncbi:MAG: LytTR family transcriptional regulator DNA-binding domain-containing protein [Clostridia bacterium]|nr:LytTR family transcriptional regulator DNA-binding domain-containing protein [Clostridia bacterium]